MKSLLIAILLISGLCGQSQQTGYQIDITLKPYQSQYVYLGYYYGKIKALADSALLDQNSRAVLKGDTKLNGGIYFVVSPRKEILFEVLLDKQQHFSIIADSANIPAGVQFSNSPENSNFQYYSRFATQNGRASAALVKDLSAAKNAGDSGVINNKLKSLNQQMSAFRDSIVKAEPG
ncbi:MAG: hypothetical protein H7Y27_04360, partial [Gemmatimonadaceae bacterium]|nr:hypothetical protein [Chitinophagaceae bacterium]